LVIQEIYMSDEKESQIEIEVEKAEDSAPEIQVVSAESSPEPARDDVDNTLNDLRKRLDEERQARYEAERKAQEAMYNVAQARNEVEDTNLHLVTNAIGTLKQNSSILKDRYKAAMEVSDYDAVAEIQQEMANNSTKLTELERGKAAMESRPRTEMPQMQTVADPVEALASQLSPRSAEWVRSHPEYATNANLREKMIAAHRLAVADNMAPDSEGYFEYVEDILKIRKSAPVQQEETSAASKPVQRRSSPPSAPVSRSGTGDGSRPNVVRLTSEEREMASMMGMTDKQYAESKLKLIEEGRLTKH
jgi:rubrerythrin